MGTNNETSLRVTRDLAVTRNTMVAAKHPLAVDAALDILDKGGNAVDAAATAAFAIGVVEPWMSGVGGVGFMTIQMAGKEPVVIDYFGRAPGEATADMYELTGEERSVVGFGGVKGVRQGKVFDLILEGTDQDAARAQLTGMCEKLLANTVIENYQIEISN